MIDPDRPPSPTTPTGGGKRRPFLTAFALVYVGYWLIADDPNTLHALLLFPLVVCAYIVLALHPQDRTKDAFDTTPSTEADAAGLVARSLADRWPAFSAFVLAPLVALGCVLLLIKAPRAFVFFSSEGSAAGLVVPLVMWALVLGGFITAGVLFFRAMKHLDK